MSDAKPLTIRAKESDSLVYHVQKAFLAGVSVKLAEHCSQQPAKLDVNEDAFRIFLTWLMLRNLDDVGSCQVNLAQAWNFGAQYEMPDFQDAVMHELVDYLNTDPLSPLAMVEAYEVTERGTKLQRAFIAQLAIDMCREGAHASDSADFTENRLEKVTGFKSDITEALYEADGNAGLNISDFLLKLQNYTY